MNCKGTDMSAGARVRRCIVSSFFNASIKSVVCFGILLLPTLNVMGCGTALAGPSATAPISLRHAPIRSQNFVSSIGVNVHIMYANSSYKNLKKVISALRYLGIDNVRDGAPAFPPGGNGRFAQAARAGLRFDFIVGNNLDVKLAWLASLERRFPGSVAAIEGPNEVNNWPVHYDGTSGTVAANLFQSALYKAVKKNSCLRNIPIYNFTDYPLAAGMADFANIHPYPKGGRQPYRALLHSVAKYSRLMPGKSVVITEAGYPTLKRPTPWGGVNPTVQAQLTINLLLDSAYLGIHRVYLYQLFDSYADPTGTSPDRHLGLFNFSYHPKPVAIAIHNLISLLHDNSTNSRTFVTYPLGFTVPGLPKTAKALLFERANGTAIVGLWNEQKIWDRTRFRPLSRKSIHLVLDLTKPHHTLSVYDPIHSNQPEETVHNTDSIAFHLGDDPIFIMISK